MSPLTRGSERSAKRLLLAAALLLLVGAGLLLAQAWREAHSTPALPAIAAPGARKPFESGKDARKGSDPQVARLETVRMSRTVAKPQTAGKPSAPALSAIIRVKGIMDYGDPKENEAIIEVLYSGKTVSCKTGDKVEGIEAVVRQIDTAVVFAYDNGEVRLEVWREGQAESLPVASPDRPAPALANELRERP